MQTATYILTIWFTDDLYNEVEEEFTCRKKAEERYDEVSWENTAELYEFSGPLDNLIRSTH
tara:strand:+ start:1088 stop:1270 length:183 start_codon:yes stop_codon:yes gene_type:complete